jgi:hypothetical protein
LNGNHFDAGSLNRGIGCDKLILRDGLLAGEAKTENANQCDRSKNPHGYSD